MNDKQTLSLLEEIDKIESRLAWFWVQDIDGFCPNLLNCVQTVPASYLKNIELTKKEKNLLDQGYPLNRAFEILGSLGLKNFFIYQVPNGSYPDIDSASIRLGPTLKYQAIEDLSRLTTDEIVNRSKALLSLAENEK